jgi:hypothetical protein
MFDQNPLSTCLFEMRSDFSRQQYSRLDIDVQDLLDGAVWHVQDKASSWVHSRI